MRFSKEMELKAKVVTSVEELLQLAKEENIEMSVEEAKEYLSRINTLTDEELEMVNGGVWGAPLTKPIKTAVQAN